jgi:hypothetical protein
MPSQHGVSHAIPRSHVCDRAEKMRHDVEPAPK